MQIPQRYHLALIAAGLGLSFAVPAQAVEQAVSWTQSPAQPPAPVRLALLPPLPAAPRIFAITPERRALLNTIRYAEGTWANGNEVGYRTMFGGSLMGSLERHPNRVMYSTRYASAAAGAYQFMPFTWEMVQNAMGLQGFYPDVQDQAALYLIQRRQALPLADRGELSPDLAARLAPEWASFPTLAGNSFYGQPVKRYDELKRFYDDNLSQLRQTESESIQQWEEVAIRQVPVCNDQSLSCKLESVTEAGNGNQR